MSGPEYRINKTTGQVIKDDGTGWKPVASVRSKTTGEILIDEGNGWQPMPGSSSPAKPDPAMTLASQRANQAVNSGQKIAQDDLTRLGRPDFSGAAMARLPAPTMRPEELDAFDAQRATEKERLRVPDSNFKERLTIALNTPTFGNAPRFVAGVQTLGALAATPFVEGDIIDREGISGATSQFLNDARVHQRRGREERPVESIATELVPALIQGKTIIDTVGKKLLPKTNTVSNVTRTAGVSGAYGALYGGSQDESGTVEGAAGGAAFGGALGVGGGLILKAAEPAVTAGYRTAKTGAATISDTLAGLLGKAGGARDRVADDVAIAAVRRSADRSGMTVDQMLELVKRYEGKPAVLAEILGQDAINALTALTRRPGSTPQKAQAIIEERAFARPERMKADVEDATGIQIGQLGDTLDAQLTERQAAAKPLYDALYKTYSTVKSFPESLKRINRIARTPAMHKHLKLAEEAVKTQAALRQVPISKMSKMEYWDLVKRSLDDEINSAVAKGEARTKVGASVAELTQLKKAITDEFDRLTNGAYATAREAGGEAPRLRAAAMAGQKALQARNPREVAKTVAATLSQDLPALRAGIVDDLGTRIDKGMTPSRVRVPDVAGKLRAGLGEDAANKLINRLDAEATLSETGARWAPRMNSVTGTVMESGATAMGDDLINAGFNLASGNKVGLLRQAINFMRQRGFSQRQIDAIGDLLLSSPEEGLKRLKLLTPDGAPVNAFAPAAGAVERVQQGSTVGAPTPSPTGVPIRANGMPSLKGVGRSVAFDGLSAAAGYKASEGQDLTDDGKVDWQDRTAGALGAIAVRRGVAPFVRKTAEFMNPSMSPGPRRIRPGTEPPVQAAKTPMTPEQIQSEWQRAVEMAKRDLDAAEGAGTYSPENLQYEAEQYFMSQHGGRNLPEDTASLPAQVMSQGGPIRSAGFTGQANPQGPGAPRSGSRDKLENAFALGASTATIAPPDADAQGAGSAELDAANERVKTATKTVADTRANITKLQSQLDMLQDPKGDIAAKQEILKLRGRPLGTTGPKGDGVDGVDGPNTTAAITDEAAKIEAAIAREQGNLEKAQKDEASALKDAKQARLLKIQEEAKSGPVTEALHEGGRFAAGALGLWAAYKLRKGAVVKSEIAAQAAARTANSLLNAKPVSSGINGVNTLNTRAPNVNDFWRLGGSGENVPFEHLQKGGWKPRKKDQVADAANLFAPPTKWETRVQAKDVVFGGAALGEAGISTANLIASEEKIKTLEADIERFAAAGDEAGMDRAIESLKLEKNMKAAWQAGQALGLMLAAGRAKASFDLPYGYARPDIAAAQRERALLLDAIAAGK